MVPTALGDAPPWPARRPSCRRPRSAATPVTGCSCCAGPTTAPSVVSSAAPSTRTGRSPSASSTPGRRGRLRGPPAHRRRCTPAPGRASSSSPRPWPRSACRPSEPSRVPVGGSLTVSGTVRAADGSGLAGRMVRLQVRGPNGWFGAGSATTDADGTVALATPAARRTVRYRLRVGQRPPQRAVAGRDGADPERDDAPRRRRRRRGGHARSAATPATGSCSCDVRAAGWSRSQHASSAPTGRVVFRVARGRGARRTSSGWPPPGGTRPPPRGRRWPGPVDAPDVAGTLTSTMARRGRSCRTATPASEQAHEHQAADQRSTRSRDSVPGPASPRRSAVTRRRRLKDWASTRSRWVITALSPARPATAPLASTRAGGSAASAAPSSRSAMRPSRAEAPSLTRLRWRAAPEPVTTRTTDSSGRQPGCSHSTESGDESRPSTPEARPTRTSCDER